MQSGLAAHQRATGTASDSSAIRLAHDRSAWKDRDVGDDLDPDLFFTGMMNGCSVWVSGDPTQPLVYHINRASFNNDQVKKLLDEGKDRDKNINQIKSKQMEQDFRAFDASGGAGKSSDYAKVTPATENMRNPIGGKAADAAKDARTKVIRTLVGGSGEHAYYIQKQMVSAFGVRVAGIWNFYEQDIYEYFLYDSGGNVDRFNGRRVWPRRGRSDFFPEPGGSWPRPGKRWQPPAVGVFSPLSSSARTEAFPVPLPDDWFDPAPQMPVRQERRVVRNGYAADWRTVAMFTNRSRYSGSASARWTPYRLTSPGRIRCYRYAGSRPPRAFHLLPPSRLTPPRSPSTICGRRSTSMAREAPGTTSIRWPR